MIGRLERELIISVPLFLADCSFLELFSTPLLFHKTGVISG